MGAVSARLLSPSHSVLKMIQANNFFSCILNPLVVQGARGTCSHVDERLSRSVSLTAGHFDSSDNILCFRHCQRPVVCGSGASCSTWTIRCSCCNFRSPGVNLIPMFCNELNAFCRVKIEVLMIEVKHMVAVKCMSFEIGHCGSVVYQEQVVHQQGCKSPAT
jgi:hypothetical protein